MRSENKYCIIGGGPAGLCGAKNLKDLNIPFDAYDTAPDIGGLWNINNPNSTVYESAHLISSKTTTEFKDYPMPEGTADYPSHRALFQYFKDYASHFNLYEHFTLNTKILKVERDNNNNWNVSFESKEPKKYKGLIIASGTLWDPKIPKFKGSFSGQIIHSKFYKNSEIFQDKKVLIVGAGNSGCDIAVDAIHRAKKVSMSVRRGYHFVPKYVFGKPADTMGGLISLPPKIKQKVDGKILKLFTGDPVKLGFPEPDHKLYESHPIVNTLVLYHLGHGDMDIKADIDFMEGDTIYFKDGTNEDYDIILLATGYNLSYPYIDKKYLNWQNHSPNLYLNIFHPEMNNLFVLGMIEAAGIGWEGRNEQAKLVASFIKNHEKETPKADTFIQKKKTPYVDLSGGYRYMKKANMAYYVHKDTYRNRIRKEINLLK